MALDSKMTFLQNGFISWTAITAVCLVLWLTITAIVQSRRPLTYTRSRVYGIWPRQREFRLRGIESHHDVFQFLSFLTDHYGAEVIANDPEPDEERWLVGADLGRIELYFDDHERARIRSVKNGGRFFDRLLRDINLKRRWFF